MNTNNNNEINNNKKGSTKGTKIDGKYIPSKEQKSQYLQTYKNKPCYNLLLKCPLCDAQYIKANEEKHNKSKKHLSNKNVMMKQLYILIIIILMMIMNN